MTKDRSIIEGDGTLVPRMDDDGLRSPPKGPSQSTAGKCDLKLAACRNFEIISQSVERYEALKSGTSSRNPKVLRMMLPVTGAAVTPAVRPRVADLGIGSSITTR